MPDPAFWRGRRVLLTGHTGFKGGWTALWLARMGAEVTGLALAPDTAPSLFDLAGIAGDVHSQCVDLREREAVADIVAAARPQIVLHLAAQPLVRRSLADPVGTYATNVMGTAHLLDALAERTNLDAILVVTSDKVYANAETGSAFVEADPLGGKDPYSASKAAAEMVVASFRASCFEPRGVPLATARGGNVIGGGDFAEDRIVPDVVRAAQACEAVILRHPEAVRPWQHVLDCVGGYLVYAEALAMTAEADRALNFGPEAGPAISVGELAAQVQGALGVASNWRHEPVADSVEAGRLQLDSSRARHLLGWRDRLPGDAAVAATARWYATWLSGADMREGSIADIAAYERA